VAARKRPLDRLIRGLGQDVQLADTPEVDASRIVLVSVVDNLAFAKAAASFGRMLITWIPSAGAATFSSFEFTPDEGLWVREMFTTGGNSRLNLSFGGGPTGAYSVQDGLGLTNAVCGRPEDTDFDGFTQTTLAQLVGGAPGVPKIFRDAQVGQAVAQPNTGVFTAGASKWFDLFVPAGCTFSLSGNAVNVGVTTYMQIDLPAENFFT